ncbi:MAG: hypothetical protein MI749_05335 [Desulfovibrionales bacterium]|nr:hypothetical protein [Desulfovibrionales bacterium]
MNNRVATQPVASRQPLAGMLCKELAATSHATGHPTVSDATTTVPEITSILTLDAHTFFAHFAQ